MEECGQSAHISQQRVEWKHSKRGREQAGCLARTAIEGGRVGIQLGGGVLRPRGSHVGQEWEGESLLLLHQEPR